VILNVPVGSFDEQSADDAGVAVADGHHQRGVALVVLLVERGEFGAGEQVGDHFLAVHVAGPVQGSAAVGVGLVDAYPVLEVDEGQHHVLLRGQVERVQARLRAQLLVDCVVLHQVLDDVHVAVVGCVEQRGESLAVLHVHPGSNFLVFVALKERLFPAELPEEVLLGPADEEADDVEVPLVGQLMQHCVALGVGERDQIEILVFFQVFVDLVDLPVAKKYLDDLAFLSPSLGHREIAAKAK
jgi:hypothetical protein